MKIFLTGGTGFIGSAFLSCALERGHEVIALRRPGSTPATDLPQPSTWVVGDLESIPSTALERVDCVVHLAATGVSPRSVSWEDAMRWNVAGLARLITAAHAAGVGRILIGGTCQEFGKSGERYAYLLPNAELEPVGPYATSKAMASMLAGGMARDLGLRLAVLRLFHCYGCGQGEGSFWSDLRKAALAGQNFAMTAGEQVYDFTPIEAMSVKLCDAVENLELQPGDPAYHNLGSGTPTRLADFARYWWQRFDAKGELQVGARPYRPGELMRLVPALAVEPGPEMASPARNRVGLTGK